jgi:hypothetical protein
MDNYQANNIIAQLENITQLLKTQNQLIEKLLPSQEELEYNRKQRLASLQEVLRNAEETNPKV